MTSKIKLAIAGLGLVGKRHAEAIAQIDQASFAFVVELQNDGIEFARNMGATKYNSIADLFETEKPDGIILATPTPLHVEQALDCITNNCPVLIEKPLAVKSEDGKAIVELCSRNKVPALVGHHRRYNPIIQKTKELIDQNRIGEIRAVHANCWFYKPDNYFEVAKWRKKKGAGPISVNLTHDVDLLRYWCGEVEVVQAQATKSLRGFENEDVASAVLKFESGAIATITVSDAIASPWSWEHTSGEYPIYPKTDEACYLIGGSKGSLSVPDMKIWSHENEPDWWTDINAEKFDYEKSDPLINQINHFCDVISRKAEPLVSANEGYKTLQVIEAIQIAAESGETVRLT